MNYSPDKLSIGIYGGGQLARMMVLASHRLGITPWVMSSFSSDPAAQVTLNWLKGNPSKEAHAVKLLNKVKVATVESEFLNASVLQTAIKKTKVPVFPTPQLLEKLQDRFYQKMLLNKLSLPSLPFLQVNEASHLHFAVGLFGFPLVLKKRRFGYDGYGTFLLHSHHDVRSFISDHITDKYGYIAEPWVKFNRELAISIVRNKRGQVVMLPLVETKQSQSICRWVKGPVEPHLLKDLPLKLKRFVESTHFVGILAFELFDTAEGIIINELAPRVHNSAHYSQDALSVCQFEYHLRAVLNLDLPPVRQVAAGFAMVNLLGKGRKTTALTTSGDVSVHWYGKSENRQGRKLGHLNALAETSNEALNLALHAERKCRL